MRACDTSHAALQSSSAAKGDVISKLWRLAAAAAHA